MEKSNKKNVRQKQMHFLDLGKPLKNTTFSAVQQNLINAKQPFAANPAFYLFY